MKLMRMLTILIGLSAPARGDWKTVDTVLLTAAETSLALDMLQTFDLMHRDRFVSGAHEINPLLGRDPSDAALLGYFAGIMATTAIVTYLLPDSWRRLVPIAVLVVEVPVISQNAAYGLKLRLPF